MSFFVPGEPVLSGGRGQDEWQERIRVAMTAPIRRPHLTFFTSSLRRRGHLFDLDNLVHPVLMVFDEPVNVAAARIYLSDEPGLLVEDRQPDPPPNAPLTSIYVSSHSTGSSRTRKGIPEIAGASVFDEHEGLGLHLKFDRADIPIRRGWFGPTEAVIDDLVPWLGTYTARELIADHRIRDLRIERGLNPSAQGVSISIWYVPDRYVVAPPELVERIRAGS